MKDLKIIAVIVISSFLFSSCVIKSNSVEENHKTQVASLNKKVFLSSFDKISAEGSVNVIITQSDTSSVFVKGNNTKAFEKLVIYVEDNTLYIGTKNDFLGINQANDIDETSIYITTPNIKSIDFAGSGNLNSRSTISSDELSIQLAGCGEINFNDSVMCNNIKVIVAGTGNILFKRVKANHLTSTIAGTGDIYYENLDVDNAVSEIAGVGNISLSGKARTHTESVAGTGSIDTSGLTKQ